MFCLTQQFYHKIMNMSITTITIQFFQSWLFDAHSHILMSVPDSKSSIWDFFQNGGPYGLGEGRHLAMIPSSGEVLVWMNIWEFFPQWTTLSNCPCANNLSVVLKPLSKVSKILNWCPFLDLHLAISDGFVSSKIYDKRDDFDFDIVNFHS